MADVHVILGITGDAAADAELATIAAALQPGWSAPERSAVITPLDQPSTVEVISTTDADDEVRLAVRAVLDAGRAGTPFARMAVLWSAERPYARLVEHHLAVAEIEWNGRPGTRLVERLVPRLVIDLLDVDRRGLRRRDLFDLLADVPARGADGELLHTAAWERVSRAAGVARDEHWTPRLGAYAARERRREDAAQERGERNAADAEALATFVTGAAVDARSAVRHPALAASGRLGAASRSNGGSGAAPSSVSMTPSVPLTSRSIASSTGSAISTRSARRCTAREFRATFLAELEVAPPRQGRIGAGLTTGALAGAAGLDVDFVVVVGAVRWVAATTASL